MKEAKTKSRAQLLWLFQAYLDAAGVWDPERRERLNELYLERRLARDMEKGFRQWLTTRQVITEHTVIMRTRGSRLAVFTDFLDQRRPFHKAEDRQRLTRFYLAGKLARDVEREFHQFCRQQSEAGDYRRLPR